MTARCAYKWGLIRQRDREGRTARYDRHGDYSSRVFIIHNARIASRGEPARRRLLQIIWLRPVGGKKDSVIRAVHSTENSRGKFRSRAVASEYRKIWPVAGQGYLRQHRTLYRSLKSSTLYRSAVCRVIYEISKSLFMAWTFFSPSSGAFFIFSIFTRPSPRETLHREGEGERGGGRKDPPGQSRKRHPVDPAATRGSSKFTLYIYSAAISRRWYQKAAEKLADRRSKLTPANFILCLANKVSAHGKLHRVLFMNKSLFMRRITRRHNAVVPSAFIVVLYLRHVSD